MDTQDTELNLLDIAGLAMITHGLEPEYSADVLRELDAMNECASEKNENLRDMTELLWCSIDNDDSMDLDQITVAEKSSNGTAKIFVAISDVDALVKMGSAIDQHAQKNTTSVYTGVKTFSMLPEKLSTNLSSLSEGEVRIAIVIEMLVNTGGDVESGIVYRALVKNKAKLAYNVISPWLEGKQEVPDSVRRLAGLDAQLRLQDEFAQKMKTLRHKHGALDLETIETRAVLKDGKVVDMAHERKNRAGELIEDFMVGANGVTARYLTSSGYPTLRRVVRSPERWERIVEIAADLGEKLPHKADSKALSEFLSRCQAADPLRFPDLSLTVIKLLGRGEYYLEMPGETPVGHFGLAVRDYNHSTAPNRRFPDLITQRLLKAALKKKESPYSKADLAFLATHCTHQENAADRVERQVRKSAAASFMSSKIGERFDAIVTGASEKGTWARTLHPPVEGKVLHRLRNLDVGDRVRLKLISVNIEQGFIDFAQVGH